MFSYLDWPVVWVTKSCFWISFAAAWEAVRGLVSGVAVPKEQTVTKLWCKKDLAEALFESKGFTFNIIRMSLSEKSRQVISYCL